MSGDPHDLVGQILDKRYRVDAKLGEGGMGYVFVGMHVTLDRKIAIKTLHPRLAYEKKFRERFLREAKSASRVRHPNVVQIMDFGDTPDGSVYFVMEYLEGRDLRDLLKAEGKLPWPRARNILLQAVSALGAAHKEGIVHRDIKPGNCFLEREDGGREVVKLLDFGIAKAGTDAEQEGGSKLTGTGEVFGTAAYMAPEQARGETLDARSDMYSLGIMAYEMLTGQVPFSGVNAIHVITKHLNESPEPPRKLEPSIPAQVETVILRTIAKEKKDRLASMAELEAALAAIPEDAEHAPRKTIRMDRGPGVPQPRPRHPVSGLATAVQPKIGDSVPPPPAPRPRKTLIDHSRPPPGRKVVPPIGQPKPKPKKTIDTGRPRGRIGAPPPVGRPPGVRKTAVPGASLPPQPPAPMASSVRPRQRVTIPASSDVPMRRPKATTEPARTAQLESPATALPPSKPESSSPGIPSPVRTAVSSPVRIPPNAETSSPGVRTPPNAESSSPGVRMPPTAEISSPGVRMPPNAEISSPGVPALLPNAARDPSMPPPAVPGAPQQPLAMVPSGELRSSAEITTPPPGQADHPTSPAPQMSGSTSGTGPLVRQSGPHAVVETNPHRLDTTSSSDRPKRMPMLVAAVAVGLVSVGVGLALAVDEPDETTVAAPAPAKPDSSAEESNPLADEPDESATAVVKPANAGTNEEPEPGDEAALAPTDGALKPETLPLEFEDEPPASEAETKDDEVLILEDEVEQASDDSTSVEKHLTKACANQRAAADQAYKQRTWGDVIKLTRLASCWSRSQQDKRRSYRVYAYLNVGNYKKCAAAGRYVRDSTVKKVVENCKKQAGKQ